MDIVYVNIAARPMLKLANFTDTSTKCGFHECKMRRRKNFFCEIEFYKNNIYFTEFQIPLSEGFIIILL